MENAKIKMGGGEVKQFEAGFFDFAASRQVLLPPKPRDLLMAMTILCCRGFEETKFISMEQGVLSEGTIRLV